MLEIHVKAGPSKEFWDPKKEEFIYIEELDRDYDLSLEHSLISISLWESKWHMPFISKEAHTEEQTIHYIKCMTINKNVPDAVYDHMTLEDVKKISDYIHDPMTATTVSDFPGENRKSRQVITSEVIYSWMVGLQIPWEAQKWHLNRLLKLVEVCNAQNTPPKKMSKNEIMRRNKELNAARRAKYNSKG